MSDPRLRPDLTRMSGLLRAWDAGVCAARRQRMASFLTAFASQRREGSAGELAFNVLSLLRLGGDEVRHSRVLAWLLSSGAEHGEGASFARALIEACGLAIDPEALGHYRVLTEYVGLESRTDIVLYRRGELLVFVENKVYAPEGYEQTDREYRDLNRLGESLGVPPERRFAVFLTPEGRRPSSRSGEHWRAVSHRAIAEGFGRLLPKMTSPKARYFLQDWLDTLVAFGGEDDRQGAV